MSDTKVIVTEGLTKYYGAHLGIADLDMEVREGEVFGFLGPNGAGKTTTIRILLDILRPTRGTAKVFGLDAQREAVAIKRRLGNMPGEMAVYEGLKGREVLDLLGSFHGAGGTRRAKELAERLDLDLGRPVRAYSRGMRQKLSIIQAFMHDPELVVMDEPTSGLDPLMQRDFYALIDEEHRRGKTVFFSSHNLSEVERLCQRVAIVREGRLALVDTVEAVRRRKVRKLRLRLEDGAQDNVEGLPGTELVHRNGNEVEYFVTGPVQPLLRALAALPVEEVTFPEPTLEEAFLEFYQGEPIPEQAVV